MPKMDWDVDVDFRPIAQDGWAVIEAALVDGDVVDGVVIKSDISELCTDVFPLAGWMVRSCSCDLDEPEGAFHSHRERHVLPAYFGTERYLEVMDGDSQYHNIVVYLVGPGQTPPSEETMRDDVTGHIARMDAMAAARARREAKAGERS